MYTVTKNGKTFEELESEINAKTFKSDWQNVLSIAYPGTSILDDSWPELSGIDLYKRLRPFQLIDGSRVFATKLPYNDINDILIQYKSDLLTGLTGEFDYLQREKDYGDRIANLSNWKLAANELSIFQDYNNIALLAKKIIDDNLIGELDALEIKNAEIQAEADFQANVDLMQQGQSVGSRVIAVIAQLNTDNNITATQLNTVYSSPSIQAILALLQTGALNSAKFQIQNLDLTGLEPMNDTYKTRTIAMIDEALGL